MTASSARAGWKVAAVTPRSANRSACRCRSPRPFPLAPDARRQPRPATLRIADFIAPKLECEFAFELARDLPPRPERAYSRDEVAAAIAALRIAVEIVDSRLPRGLGALAELADGFNNGAFVAGPALRDWHGVDFAGVEIVLTRSRGGRGARGRARQRRRSSTAIRSAPSSCSPTRQPSAARGCVAGDIVTTGSCTGAPCVRARALPAEFGRPSAASSCASVAGQRDLRTKPGGEASRVLDVVRARSSRARRSAPRVSARPTARRPADITEPSGTPCLR